MTMDNLTDGLKEALEKCDEAQKPEIQRSFARMIQSSVFLAESKLKYASDKNKKEANAKIGEQEAALQQWKADLNSAVKRFNSLKTMCPLAPDVKKEIDAYKSFLDALEAKYAVG